MYHGLIVEFLLTCYLCPCYLSLRVGTLSLRPKTPGWTLEACCTLDYILLALRLGTF